MIINANSGIKHSILMHVIIFVSVYLSFYNNHYNLKMHLFRVNNDKLKRIFVYPSLLEIIIIF